MKRSIRIIAAVSFAIGCGIVIPDTAFGASWVVTACAGVAGDQRGLWFDSPGAGPVNETGLFWLVTDEPINERCTFETASGGPDLISTLDFPTLRVRVAVNDGARFRVEAFGGGLDQCQDLVASMTTDAAEDDSSFRIKEVALPLGHSICKVAITLDDDPNDSPGVDGGRAKALIDYIHIRNDAAIGWAETFTAGNP